MTDFTLTRPPVTEDPKGPLMHCFAPKCLLITRYDDCPLDDAGDPLCPWCKRSMRRYHAEKKADG